MPYVGPQHRLLIGGSSLVIPDPALIKVYCMKCAISACATVERRNVDLLEVDRALCGTYGTRGTK
jgi:hypothetical protein